MDRLDELKRLAGPFAYSTHEEAEGGSRQEGLVLWAVAEIERLRATLANLCIDIETVVDHDDVTTKETWRAVKELANTAMRMEPGDA